MPGVASAANQSTILSPGQEADLDSSSVQLRPLTDGRLAGAGMEVQVEGVAFTDEVSDDNQTVSAAPGAQLVVVETNTTWQIGDSVSTATDTTGLTIESGSNSAQLQLSQVDYPSSGDQYFAVAIPTNGPAVLTLSVAGLTQTLDLRTDTRPATAPKILYRSQTSPFLTVSPNSVTDFTASSSLGPVTGQFGIANAYLSAWQPFTQTYVRDPATAYLDVEFSPTNMAVSGANGGPATPTGALGNGQVVFDLPDGRSIPATNTLATTGGNDFFSGDFYALVPADLASVKVILAGTMPASVESQTTFEQQATTITLSAPLTETVNFPPASAPTPAPGTPVTIASPAKPKSKVGSTSPVLFVGLGLLVLLIAGSLAFAARRRTQTLPATPVVWPPRQLSRPA